MGFSDENFRNSKYIRLKVLTDLRNRDLLTERLEWTDGNKLERKPKNE
jgi:hypothetical protein